MNKVVRVFCLTVIAITCVAITSHAQTSMPLIGSMAGQVSNGSSMCSFFTPVGSVTNTPILCDGFSDESYFASTWNTRVTSFSNNLASSGAENYLESQRFTTGPLTIHSPCSKIFGNSNCNGHVAREGGLRRAGLSGGYTANGSQNPVAPSPSAKGTLLLCTAGPANCPGKESMTVTVPEGGTTIAYLLLAGICCAGAMFLRSRRRIATSAIN